MSIQDISKRLGSRDWDEVTGYWQNFLSSTNFPIDENYTEENLLFKLEEIASDIKNIENNSTERNHYNIIPGIQYNIFPESIYLFYKSLNSIKSAQVDQNNGYKTWCINSYYQSSYFSMKCFLNIIGVFSCLVNGNYLLIDLLPSYKKISRRDFSGRRDAYELRIQKTKQLGHCENWIIFKRMIKVTKRLPIDEKILNFLSSVDESKFAKQRNKIIYHNNEWIFKDLKDEIIDCQYGTGDFSNENDDDFTLIVSFLLLHLNFTLFSSISKINEKFNIEFCLIQKSMSSVNNNQYMKFIRNNNIFLNI